MTIDPSANIYAQLGIRPTINATGHVTILGGSTLSTGVMAALNAANAAFAPMDQVLDRTGAAIAQMVGTEHAYVASGCFAALVLGAAGIMAGDDPERIARLPDTTGMKDEFLLQKPTRYRYDRCVSVPGGKLVEVGDAQACTPDQLAAAIGPQTAAILFFARGEKLFPNTVGLAQTIQIAHQAGVPVLMDAAGEIFPVERMHELATSGADLLTFGGKYLGSGNSTGILCGRRDLVHAAGRNGFTEYEFQNNRAIGRGYKIDRQEVLATTVALQEWLTMDHEERLHRDAARLQIVQNGLADLPHVRVQEMWEQEGGPWMRLHVSWDQSRVGKSPTQVEQALRDGDPSVWVRPEGSDGLFIAAHTLAEGEAEIVMARLRAEIG